MKSVIALFLSPLIYCVYKIENIFLSFNVFGKYGEQGCAKVFFAEEADNVFIVSLFTVSITMVGQQNFKIVQKCLKVSPKREMQPKRYQEFGVLKK